MDSISSSWYTNRPVDPDKSPKKVPLTEWEYQEKHGFDDKKSSSIDISDSSGFSFSDSNDELELNDQKSNVMATQTISNIDTEKIGEVLQNDLDFISTTHLTSTQKSQSALKATDDKISSAKYTYFGDLDAENQLSSASDSFGDRFSTSSKNSTLKSSKKSQSKKSTLEDELMTTSFIGPNDRSKCYIRESLNAKVADNDTSSFDIESSNVGNSSKFASTGKSTTTKSKNDTISTFQDISSLHESSDFINESTIKEQSPTKQGTNRKSVTISQTLATTKDHQKTMTNTDSFSLGTPLKSTGKSPKHDSTSISSFNDSALQSTKDITLKSIKEPLSSTRGNTLGATKTGTLASTNHSALSSTKEGTLASTKKQTTTNDKSLKSSTIDPLSTANDTSKLTIKTKIDVSKFNNKTDTLKSTLEKSTKSTTKKELYTKDKQEPITDRMQSTYKKNTLTEQMTIDDDSDDFRNYTVREIPDLTPSFMKEDRIRKKPMTVKEDKKPVLEGIPDEDDLRRERKLRKLLGTQQAELIEETKIEKVKPMKPPKPKKEQEISEKDRRRFFDPAETKATKLRNQMVRQKIIQQAEADRLKREEDDERRMREEAAAKRIRPDLIKMKKESEVHVKSLKERRREADEENRKKSAEVRKMLKRVEKESTLYSRESKELSRQEARNKAAQSMQKTEDDLHWEEVRRRRDSTNKRLREMWSGK